MNSISIESEWECPVELVREYCDNRGCRVESVWHDSVRDIVKVIAEKRRNKFNGDAMFSRGDDAFEFFVEKSNMKYIARSAGLDIVDADITIRGENHSNYGAKLKVHSDYKDKDLIKSLDWDETHRSWNSFYSCWTIDADALEQVYEELAAERDVWVDPLLWKRYENNWSE